MADMRQATLTLKVDSRQAVRGLQEYIRTADGVQVSSTRTTSALTKVTGALGGMYLAYRGVSYLKGAIQEHAKFEQNLANVSTMLSEQTMRHLPGYSRALRKLSVEVGEGTGTLSKGLYDILSASVAAEHAMGLLEVSSKAAKAGLTDTGTAADALTTILNSYKMSAAEAADVSDVLFATVKAGKITFPELAGSIGMVASTAASAGLSLEEVSAAISTMTRAGLPADIAFTALNAIMMEFLGTSEKTAKFAKDTFNLEINASTLSAIGLTGAMDTLTGASAEQVKKLFENRRAIRGVNALLQQHTGHLKDLAQAQNAAGFTQEAFNKNTDTTAFKLKQLDQALTNIKVGLGEKLSDPVKDLSEALTRFLSPGGPATGFERWLHDIGEGLSITAAGTKALIDAAYGGAPQGPRHPSEMSTQELFHSLPADVQEIIRRQYKGETGEQLEWGLRFPSDWLSTLGEGQTATMVGPSDEKRARAMIQQYLDLEFMQRAEREYYAELDKKRADKETQAAAQRQDLGAGAIGFLTTPSRMMEPILDQLAKLDKYTEKLKEADKITADFVEQLEHEQQAFTLSNTEYEKATIVREAMQAAAAKGVPLAQSQISAIEAEVEAMQSLRAEQERQEARAEMTQRIGETIEALRLEREMLGMTNVQREKATTLFYAEIDARRMGIPLAEEYRAVIAQEIDELDKAQRLAEVGRAIGDGFTDGMRGVVTALARGEDAMDALGNAALRTADMMAEILVWDPMRDALKAGMSGWLTGGGGGGGYSSAFGGGASNFPASAWGSAKGNVFDRGRVVPFGLGGIIDQPTYFPLGLAGEDGPEAILPLRETSSGRLGVELAGGSAARPQVTVNIINRSSAQVTAPPAQVAFDPKRMIASVVLEDVNNGGPISRGLQSMQGGR